ncbi:MAG: ABC transporter substrate-binding protein [Thermoleophilaceae bacterium]|nr:ABC transporter substrate-binding protein [Thermoleophilaceae bacterium]
MQKDGRQAQQSAAKPTPLSEIGEMLNAPLTRRQALAKGSALAAAAALPAWFLSACGSDTTASSGGATGTSGAKPIKIGFIPLTDCSPVVMAGLLGYYKQRGLNVQVIKQASWPATRDALISGDIDAAHGLFGMPFSVATGIGGKAGTKKLKVAMTLNDNGQGITLKKEYAAGGYGDLEKTKAALNGGQGKTFAMTFPGGTHDAWLRYWLLAMGIDMKTPKIIPIPPPQMVANMTAGNMDGYCVGEPWNAVAVQNGIGFTSIATQDIWTNHPEKALIVNADFAAQRRDDLKQVMGAMFDACKWLDDVANVPETAKKIGTPAYVNAKPDAIAGRMAGKYELGAGLGTKTFGDDRMRFFDDGKVNFPRKAYATWFLAQYQRFGYLSAAPSYKALANDLILSDLYKEVADAEGVKVPSDDMAPFTVKLDGVTFDPNDPAAEVARK